MISKGKIAGGLMAVGILLYPACIPAPGPTQRRVDTQPSPSPLSFETTSQGHSAVFYRLNPEGDSAEIVKILAKNPDLKLTLIFPSHYFEAQPHRESLPYFRVLQSSGQIEVALNLENEPNLPLLGNFQTAFRGSTPWNLSFSWPDDIAGQIAKGSGVFQKRWGKLPSGFYPPHLSLTDQVIKSLQRFRISYVLAKPRQLDWGVRSMGSTMVIVPPECPASSFAVGSPEWADELAAWTLNNPFSLADGGAWVNIDAEIAFLNSLVKLTKKKGDSFSLNKGEELQQYVNESHLITAKSDDPYANDFSPWVKSAQQKIAWQALADARKVLETYKNSGRAVLSKLDAASEEMYNAESGPFLLSLGQNQVSLPINEKNFTATIANIYRHTGTPVPDSLNRLFSFSNKKLQITSDKPGNPDEPFFVDGDKSISWNDPAGDDNGSGTFRYPYGNYPVGTFDLKKISIRWTDDFVTFSISVAGPLPSQKIQQILPMTDIYIDVNRVVGAGSQETLKQRGAIMIEREAAWEYAVALGQTTAALYQSLPGKEPRRLGIFKTTSSPSSKSFSVSIPLDSLRGNPSEWRMSIAMGGMEQSNQSDEPIPVPVMASPSPKNFGGALGGRATPHFIDFLDSSVDDQKERMKSYEVGRKTVIPYVEVP